MVYSELILIVDDDPSIRRIAGDILRQEGFRVVETINVASGIAQARLQRPDLILCDVMMPDGSGFDVLSSLQKMPELSSVPFIFMSGEAILLQDVRKGMVCGADDYLLKPFKVQDLIDSVRARLLRQRRVIDTSQILMTDEHLPPFFAGVRSDLIASLGYCEETPTSYCLLALQVERYERFVQVFGKHKAQQLIYTAIHRLSRSELFADLRFYVSDEPNKVYLYCPEQSVGSLAPLLDPLLRLFFEPLAFDRFQLHLLASVGVFCSEQDQPDSPEKIVEMADVALYHARSQGGNTYVVYQNQMEKRFYESLRWEDELRQALNEERFEVYYQPQVDLKSGQLVSFEALLRLKHPDFGIIPPSDFIPVAEESGLIVPIGLWVLQEACRTLKRLHEQNNHQLKMAVNVSLVQFRDRQFQEQVARVLDETQIPGKTLELELTENLLIENFTQVHSLLDALKELGISLAIDDFGTGYSSLYYLNQLPFDILKIDQSFVRAMGQDRQSQAVPKAIVDLGHGLDMQVLAEGIETKEQWNILQGFGCDFGQGYYMARPMPETQLCEWMKR